MIYHGIFATLWFAATIYSMFIQKDTVLGLVCLALCYTHKNGFDIEKLKK